MNKLIFNVHEDYIEIAQVKKALTAVKVEKLINFTPEKDIELNNLKLKTLLSKNKIKKKNVDIILTIDGIVTRQIEVPAMKENDLKNFISSNTSQYFTVNTGDFYFDYKVIEIRKEEKKKIFSVLLVAIPREKLNKIKALLNLHKLNINKAKIYPECLVNYYIKNRKESIAILDVGSEKSSVTILDKGKIFVYSTIILDLKDEDSPKELMDNLTYFLNFYATRHFGNKIDKVYIVGEKCTDVSLIKALNENIDMDMDITYDEINNHIELLGSLMEVKSIYNKSIDFKEALNDKDLDKPQNKTFTLLVISIFLIVLIGLGAYYYTGIYLNSNNSTLNSSLQSEIKKYSSVEKDLKDVSSEKQSYEKKIGVINEIKKDDFDYFSIIDSLRKGLPTYITVKSLDLNREKVAVVLNINNSTLDAAKAVIAINNMKLFETIDLTEVKLDDTVNSISLDLKFKNPK